MAVTEERIITRKDKSGNLKTYKRYKSTITLKGFPRVSKTFDRKTDADAWGTKTEYEMKHQLSFGPSHHLTKTLEDVIDRYLDDLKQTNPKRHRDVTPMLHWWKERIGKTRLGEVSTDLILRQREYLKTRHVKHDPKRPKVSNSYVNRVTGALNRVFNVACNEWKWIAKSPMDGLKKLPEPPGRTRFLQADEIDRLIEAARKSENKDMEAVVMLALTTGARSSEIRKIRLKDVDFSLKTILLPTSKNKKPRVLHLVEPALSLIEKAYKNAVARQIYLFCSPHDITAPNNFRTAWRTVIRNSGLTDYRFHDNRHSAASFLAMHGAGLHEISEILGHSGFGVTRRYVHLLQNKMRGTVEETARKVFKDGKAT